MNSYERHVIHTALQDHEGVSTFSTGTEPNRRVVIAYGKYKRGDRNSSILHGLRNNINSYPGPNYRMEDIMVLDKLKEILAAQFGIDEDSISESTDT
jgi:hypothetical protein